MGGANRVLTDLVSGLDRSRFRPVVVSPGDGRLTAWAAKNDVRVFVIPPADARLTSAATRAWRFARVIRRTGASIVHAIDPVCYREASWAAAVTGTGRFCHIQFPSSPDLLRWVFRVRPDLTISCYAGHVRELLRDIPELNGVAWALPNAVREDVFTSAAESNTDTRWKFGRRRMAIIVGHLSDIKGHPTFLRAAAIVRQVDADCAFVALGGETIQKGFQAQLEALASELGLGDDVHFLGWRENVAEIVRAADVFVLPSRQEGLPLALLEAMACGVPVVATPVNGISEVVKHDVNGLLVPVDDPERLAQALLAVFRDPVAAGRLAAAGQHTVQREFTISMFVDRMQEMYDRHLFQANRRSARSAWAARVAAERSDYQS
jgi:glycosyltransferase involved in cell wall biosynthesis